VRCTGSAQGGTASDMPPPGWTLWRCQHWLFMWWLVLGTWLLLPLLVVARGQVEAAARAAAVCDDQGATSFALGSDEEQAVSCPWPAHCALACVPSVPSSGATTAVMVRPVCTRGGPSRDNNTPERVCTLHGLWEVTVQHLLSWWHPPHLSRVYLNGQGWAGAACWLPACPRQGSRCRCCSGAGFAASAVCHAAALAAAATHPRHGGNGGSDFWRTIPGSRAYSCSLDLLRRHQHCCLSMQYAGTSGLQALGTAKSIHGLHAADAVH